MLSYDNRGTCVKISLGSYQPRKRNVSIQIPSKGKAGNLGKAPKNRSQGTGGTLTDHLLGNRCPYSTQKLFQIPLLLLKTTAPTNYSILCGWDA
jgi:hypothetical protein